MKVRIDEEVASVVEISYDIEMPDGADLDDYEDYLDRANDEIHRETIRVNREITNVEEVGP